MQKLNEEQNKQLKNQVDKLFKKFDKNHNQKLEKDELRKFIFTEFSLLADMTKETEDNKLEKLYQNILMNFDLNNDGIIKKDELLKALKKSFL